MKVNINPKTPTQISDSSCAVYSKNVSQLITFTDSEGNVLETSYANSVTAIPNEGPIFARSHDKEIELTVTGIQPIEQVKNLVVGTQEEIDAIESKDCSTMYVVIE